jgi:uncharacterized protein (TIGR02001 family)
MRTSILYTTILAAMFAAPVMAEETKAEEAKSDWSFSSNVALTSDYYARGLSQSWHKPAIQGGFDVAHSSGLSAGVWASSISADTFPDASMEIDLYANYGGSVPFAEGLGYTVGVIGYMYPNGSWGQCIGCTNNVGGPASDNSWNTYEANFGLSYSYFSAKVSTTLGNWFGLDKSTGYTSDSKWTTYMELNAAYPFAEGWTLLGHIGHLNVTTDLATGIPAFTGYNGKVNPDYTDYKVGVSKSFSIAGSEGWAAQLAYVGADDKGYWNKTSWGGSSFNGRTETRNLADGHLTFTVSRSF